MNTIDHINTKSLITSSIFYGVAFISFILTLIISNHLFYALLVGFFVVGLRGIYHIFIEKEYRNFPKINGIIEGIAVVGFIILLNTITK